MHVCQRWRNVALASPRRLNLRLLCPRRRRVRETLGVWPAFPIVIWDFPDFPSDEDNIIAALGHRNRVCEIKLKRFTRLQSEELLGFMDKSFPVLTNLQIKSYSLTSDEPPIFPDSFLDGSAPRLRSLYLESVSFPALPNLLLSASHLVQLHLSCIPMGFISPEMAAALSVLTRVVHMHLVFGSPNPFRYRRPVSPSADALCPPRSQVAKIRRRRQVFGRLRGPNRCSLNQLPRNIAHRSTVLSI